MCSEAEGREVVQIPIRPSLGVLGRKWTARILVDIGFRGINRFNQLIRANPRIPRRLLSKRLRELEKDDVIRRRSTGQGTVSIRWSLTPKGREMLPILMELLKFGSKWENTYKSGGNPPTLLAERPTQAPKGT